MVKYRAGRGQHQMKEVVIGAPDSVTHLMDVDLGAMTLKGLPAPAGVTAMFPDEEEPIDAPEPQEEIDEEIL